MAMMEGAFLEWNLPARAFATLTTPRPVAQCRLDESFSAWIQAVQAYHRATLGWVKTIEIVPQPHIHAALIAAGPLDCAHAEMLWRTMVAQRYADAARVEPYRDGLCGLSYIVKRLGSHREEPQFSDNIQAFAPGRGKSLFRTDSAQRRQVRRIKAAMLRGAIPNHDSSRKNERRFQ